jgi:hypothetical protein
MSSENERETTARLSDSDGEEYQLLMDMIRDAGGRTTEEREGEREGEREAEHEEESPVSRGSSVEIVEPLREEDLPDLLPSFIPPSPPIYWEDLFTTPSPYAHLSKDGTPVDLLHDPAAVRLFDSKEAERAADRHDGSSKCAAIKLYGDIADAGDALRREDDAHSPSKPKPAAAVFKGAEEADDCCEGGYSDMRRLLDLKRAILSMMGTNLDSQAPERKTAEIQLESMMLSVNDMIDASTKAATAPPRKKRRYPTGVASQKKPRKSTKAVAKGKPTRD